MGLRHSGTTSPRLRSYALRAKSVCRASPSSVSQSVFSFNPLSRPLSESQAIAEGTAKAVVYTYDQGGNRLTLRHDEGKITAAYAYDP